MVFAFLVFAVTMMHGMGCKKKTGEEECRTCQAFGIDGVIDEETVCSDAEEDAFRAKNAGHQVSCHE